MFYKIIKDGVIVDVFREDTISYFKELPVSGRVLCAKKGDKDIVGIISSDSMTKYAIVQGTNYPVVSIIEEYDDSKYDELMDSISSQRHIVYEEVADDNVDITALKTVLIQQQAEQLMDLLQTITGDLSDELIIKYPAFVEKWEDGKSYDAGKRLSYNGDVYKVVKSIGTSGATPDNSPAYYTKLN